ncbi:MAG: hypothetical protein K6C10_05375 [Prevotella sp.]|nr:hypothetical protein [Prevotella sp.]
MTKQTVALIFAFFALISVFSCGNGRSAEERQLLQRVDSFVNTYYNSLYHEAARFVTPESMPQLRFIASQITQADIDVIHQNEEMLTYEVIETDIQKDSCARVELLLRNVFTIDTIGQPGSFRKELPSTLLLDYDKEKKLWFVRLNNDD